MHEVRIFKLFGRYLISLIYFDRFDTRSILLFFRRQNGDRKVVLSRLKNTPILP